MSAGSSTPRCGLSWSKRPSSRQQALLPNARVSQRPEEHVLPGQSPRRCMDRITDRHAFQSGIFHNASDAQIELLSYLEFYQNPPPRALLSQLLDALSIRKPILRKLTDKWSRNPLHLIGPHLPVDHWFGVGTSYTLLAGALSRSSKRPSFG